jgi:hypothetical protein
MFKFKQSLVALLAIALLVGLITAFPSSSGQAAGNINLEQDLAQGIGKLLKVENRVPDQYIVVLHDSEAGPKGEHLWLRHLPPF